MDDAYKSLTDLARELIERNRLPITVFPTLDGCRKGQAFWWDRVEDLFAHAGPDRWARFEDSVALRMAFRNGQPRGLGPLRPFRQWVLATWAGRWPDELEPPLAELEAGLGYRTAQRAMTFAELDEFAALPDVEVGVHTATHPVLPLLPELEQRREIELCADMLRARYRNFVPILAAPFGLFDRQTEAVATACGMRTVLTLAGGLDQPYEPRFGVPRICAVPSLSSLRLLVRISRVSQIAGLGGRRQVDYPELPSAVS
jgi:peptidoglycan/xylan/chitin deacetylase (PgdA/CDA1 family)